MSFRTTRFLGIWALAASLLLVGFPRPASACACAAALPADLIDEADLVFVGTPTASQPAFGGDVVETMFVVDTVVKGEVGSTVVLTADADSECGPLTSDGAAIGVAAVQEAGDVLDRLCGLVDADQLLVAAQGMGLEMTSPEPSEQPTEMPESTSTYAAAIPLSVGLSLVFLAAVALGTRSTSVSR